jgi:elongation factor Ts
VTEISAGAVKALRDQTGAGMMDCKRALSDAGGDVEKAGALLRERGLAKAVKRGGRETSEGAIGIAVKGASGAIVEIGCETDFVAKTDDFQKLVQSLAEAAAADPTLTSVDALAAAAVGGEKVADRISAAIAKLGENVVLKRCARLDVPGGGAVAGYVHAGGKLGVLVGLRTGVDAAQAAALGRDVAMHVAAHDPSPVAVERSGVAADVVEKERAIFRAQAEGSGKPAPVIEKIVEGRVNKFYAEVCLVEQSFVKDPERTVGDLLRDAGKKLGGEIAVSAFVRFKLGEASGA